VVVQHVLEAGKQLRRRIGGAAEGGLSVKMVTVAGS
jgi:hypothetical protein